MSCSAGIQMSLSYVLLFGCLAVHLEKDIVIIISTAATLIDIDGILQIRNNNTTVLHKTMELITSVDKCK